MTGCDNWLMDEMKPRRASTERLHCDVVSGSQWTIDFTYTATQQVHTPMIDTKLYLCC